MRVQWQEYQTSQFANRFMPMDSQVAGKKDIVSQKGLVSFVMSGKNTI